MKQLVLDLIPAPAPSLANFVAGRNAEVLARLSALTSTESAAPLGVLYIWGMAGAGKSHLVSALATAIGNRQDVAAVDDVQKLDEPAQQQLFNLINRQQVEGGFLLAAGNVAPRDLPLRRDLASRLGSGLVFQLAVLTDAEKAEALRAHAASRGFNLREDVIQYLLRHARRDMPSLVKMLDALDSLSIETGREITLPLLREVSQPTLI